MTITVYLIAATRGLYATLAHHMIPGRRVIMWSAQAIFGCLNRIAVAMDKPRDYIIICHHLIRGLWQAVIVVWSPPFTLVEPVIRRSLIAIDMVTLPTGTVPQPTPRGGIQRMLDWRIVYRPSPAVLLPRYL